MHQAPARVHVHVLVQPLQRAQAAPGQAVVDFFLLLGDMDMYRALLVAGCQHFGDLPGRNRAQRMEAQTQLLRGLGGQQRGQLRLQLQVLFGGVDEAPLPVIRGLAAEACVAVQHRQQGQANAAVGRGRADAAGQLGRVGVGLAGLVVVHVVEFGHRGVAGLEHLDVQLAGDDLQLLRADLADQAVHQVAPGPETVVGVAGDFRQPCHGALEGMRVQVGHAGQQRAGQPLGAFGRGTRFDAGHMAITGDLDADMAGPARGQQGAFGEVGGHR
ncbi:hypothetical protein D3C80_521780 [compost metagenome]